MTAEEQVQSVIDELKAGRKGAWIFDENSNVKADVYTFDAVKILEALKDNGDVISQELPVSPEDVRQEAEFAKNVLKELKTVGDILDYIEENYDLNLDTLQIINGETLAVTSLDYLPDLEDLPRDWKVASVELGGGDGYAFEDYITDACYNHETGDFEFSFEVDGDVVAEDVKIENVEDCMKAFFDIYDPERFAEKVDKDWDNTYNYACNISNDMAWCESVNEDGDRIAMLKFHIAGDVRGNYTDEIFVDIDGYGGLLEYLYDRLNLPECRSLGDCTIDIDPFSEGVNILTEDGREFKCYDIEEKDIVAKIEEETGAKMKAFNKSDVKDDKPKTNTITKE